MEPLTQSALWQLVLGLAVVILILAGLLYAVDKCGTARSEVARRDAPGATDVAAGTPDRGQGEAHHRPERSDAEFRPASAP